MAYGSRFCDLFQRFELLLLHSEAKKLGLPCLLVPYKPLVIILVELETPAAPVYSLPVQHN